MLIVVAAERADVKGLPPVIRITSLTLAVGFAQAGSEPVISNSNPSPPEGSMLPVVVMPGLVPGPKMPAPPTVPAKDPVPPSREPAASVTSPRTEPLTTSVPAETVVPPVWAFAPESTSEPLPVFVRLDASSGNVDEEPRPLTIGAEIVSVPLTTSTGVFGEIRNGSRISVSLEPPPAESVG